MRKWVNLNVSTWRNLFWPSRVLFLLPLGHEWGVPYGQGSTLTATFRPQRPQPEQRRRPRPCPVPVGPLGEQAGRAARAGTPILSPACLSVAAGKRVVRRVVLSALGLACEAPTSAAALPGLEGAAWGPSWTQERSKRGHC